MSILFAETFFEALVVLSPEEQSQVNEALFTFMKDRTHAGLKLHPCCKPRSRGLWSIKASYAVRVIFHKSGEDWTALHTDRHDRAYDWANRRQVLVTGDVMRLVEIRKEVRERIIETVKIQPVPKPTPLAVVAQPTTTVSADSVFCDPPPDEVTLGALIRSHLLDKE